MSSHVHSYTTLNLMNLLLRYSLGFDLWYYILLSFAIVGVSVNGTIAYNVRSSSVFMPVITRSQAKLSTDSSKELSGKVSSNSSKEFLEPLSNLASTSSQSSILETSSLPLCAKNTTILSSSSSISTSPLVHDHCSIPSALLFQNSNLEFQNLEFSNVAPPTHSSSTFTLSSSQFLKMESDCKDDSSDSKMSPDMLNLAQMIANLSSQMTYQTKSLEGKLSDDFNKVIQDNEQFKSDVRLELDGIRQLLDKYNISSDPRRIPSSPSSSFVVPPNTLLSQSQPVLAQQSVTTLPINPPSSTTPDPDPQTKMMLILTETFSKLTSTLSEKKEDTKSDWPKFAGDPKKFRAWYMAIVAQISLPPWQDLYDTATQDVRTTTANSSLNAKLYAKLLVCLEGTAFQSIVSREHLRANGLLLLQDLIQTYKPKHVPEVIAAKTSQFWGNTKRQSYETIDDSYNRFRELLYDIVEALIRFRRKVR